MIPNFDLILAGGTPVLIHLSFALAAFLLGAYQLLARKGTPMHCVLGRVWVVMMLVIAVSSFWIKDVWPGSIIFGYSPIHLLSLFVIVQVGRGLYFARAGDIFRHKRVMTYTYLAGLVIAGAFTFAPGRLLYRVFFG